ncbi:hypothetical protein KIF53_13900 [Chromobacterium subtsugae]|uniref:Uncharacterized protein n=2 Tax=Chromobacterium subtsugae TaxID=251747 RepID=A0ABS7FF79_9NEIS|nr:MULTISPECIES: hypothetical protein [Chromobacterium]KUM05597.1 hypothetical protein Cv017_08275 [Chromobacterium subtsugae]KZE87667.1 hypothetical protein AWB61_10815 [Chromobacterium sp. F49]MBW7566957.1 hypothetical protein [Chromobacterium subtsugae]MBW8288724.1 hypothetical protein [Chromobacterium subtsugae]OBU85748.1 hypothetical protein MY55_14225 [Chromobacterium subtsugae]
MMTQHKTSTKFAELAKAAFDRLPYEALLAAVGILIFLAGVTVGASWGGGSGTSAAAPADASIRYKGKDEQGRPHYVVTKDSLW